MSALKGVDAVLFLIFFAFCPIFFRKSLDRLGKMCYNSTCRSRILAFSSQKVGKRQLPSLPLSGKRKIITEV